MSTVPYLQAYRQAVELLTSTRDLVKQYLQNPEHSNITIEVETGLNALINRINKLRSLAGDEVQLLTQPRTQLHADFPPITNFMGDDLPQRKEVKKEDLSPAETEKASFRQRVQDLYHTFDSIAPDGILNSYTTPEDQNVLRGVAKMAGLEDFATHSLDNIFIDKIGKAIQQKNELDAQKGGFEAELEKQTASTRRKTQKVEQEAKANETTKPGSATSPAAPAAIPPDGDPGNSVVIDGPNSNKPPIQNNAGTD